MPIATAANTQKISASTPRCGTFIEELSFGAMVAAVKCAVLLQSVAYDLDTAMGT
jgi:hypothetical protein